MCRICKDRSDVQERAAAHDFHEQMSEFYGLNVSLPKKTRVTKKSILAKIEYQLSMMGNNPCKNQEFINQLTIIVETKLDNLKEAHSTFKDVMEDYYIQRIREEVSHVRESR